MRGCRRAEGEREGVRGAMAAAAEALTLATTSSPPTCCNPRDTFSLEKPPRACACGEGGGGAKWRQEAGSGGVGGRDGGGSGSRR